MNFLAIFLEQDKNWESNPVLNYNFFINEGKSFFVKDFDSYLDLQSFVDKFQQIIPTPTEKEQKMFRRCIRECFFLRNGVWYFYPAFSYVEFGVDCIIWPEYAVCME